MRLYATSTLLVAALAIALASSAVTAYPGNSGRNNNDKLEVDIIPPMTDTLPTPVTHNARPSKNSGKLEVGTTYPTHHIPFASVTGSRHFFKPKKEKKLKGDFHREGEKKRRLLGGEIFRSMGGKIRRLMGKKDKNDQESAIIKGTYSFSDPPPPTRQSNANRKEKNPVYSGYGHDLLRGQAEHRIPSPKTPTSTIQSAFSFDHQTEPIAAQSTEEGGSLTPAQKIKDDWYRDQREGYSVKPDKRRTSLVSMTSFPAHAHSSKYEVSSRKSKPSSLTSSKASSQNEDGRITRKTPSLVLPPRSSYLFKRSPIPSDDASSLL